MSVGRKIAIRFRDAFAGTRTQLVRCGQFAARSRIVARAACLPCGVRPESDPLPVLRSPDAFPPAATVYAIPSARIRGLHGPSQAAIYDEHDCLILRLSPDAGAPHRHRVYSEPLFCRTTNLDCVALCLFTRSARDNYYHWLLELLPKLHLCERAGLDVGDLPPTVVAFLGHAGLPYQQQTLRLLGIDIAATVNIQPQTNVRSTNLIVPAYHTRDFAVPRWAAEFVRTRFLPAADARQGPERIYIDRGSSPRRRIVNSLDVRRLFERKGFVTIDPAALTFSEQVGLFRDARWIAGAHGAAFANLVFCQPRARLLEILSPCYRPGYYRSLAKHVAVQWQGIVGDLPSGTSDVSPRRAIEQPFQVDVHHLETVLNDWVEGEGE